MPRSGRFAVLAAECASAPGFLVLANDAQVQASRWTYTWKRVITNSGGYITGIGAACRSSQSTPSGTQPPTWAHHDNLSWTGVEDLSPDPVNPPIICFAVDTYPSDEAPNGTIDRCSERHLDHYRFMGRRGHSCCSYPVQLGANAPRAMRPSCSGSATTLKVCRSYDYLRG